MFKFFCSGWLEKLKKTFITTIEFQDHIDKSEKQYKDMKADVEKLRKSIDPLADLLMKMEKEFQWNKKVKK